MKRKRPALTEEQAKAILAAEVARFGPLPSGLRRRVTSDGKVQYGLYVFSQYLPPKKPGGRGGCFNWLRVGTTREEAETQLRRLYDLIDDAKRGLPLSRPDDGRSLDTFATVAEEYLDEIRTGGATVESWKQARTCVNQLRPFVGSLPILAIQSADGLRVRDTLAAPLAEGGRAQGPATVNKRLDVGTTVINFAIKTKGLRISNPWDPEKVPRLPVDEADERQVRIFKPSEDAAFLRGLAARCLKCAVAWALGLFIGDRLRCATCCRLRVDDVNLIERSITIRGRNQKRKGRKLRGRLPRRTRKVYIPNRALHLVTEAVKAAQAVGSPWLLFNEKTPTSPITPHSLSGKFAALADGLGYDGVRLHHALHNFTTRAEERALDEGAERSTPRDLERAALREAQDRRGHDSKAATLRYAHARENPHALRKWYDAMDRWHDEQERLDQDSTKEQPKTDLPEPAH